MLTTCFECGEQLSSYAKSCPHCGAPVIPDPVIPPGMTRDEQIIRDLSKKLDEDMEKFREKLRNPYNLPFFAFNG